jgi:hypothetical protein
MFITTIKRRAALILFILSIQVLYSQEKDSVVAVDAKAQVPALSEFHTVIYPLWHTAWPEKNIQMLVELLPEIEKLSANVYAAKLPGILREKRIAWENGLKELKTVIQEYQAAAAPVDSQRLLGAAEQLHRQYEKLVRIIRPALKELDAFHSVLYLVYHYYLPEWKKDKIISSVVELRETMNLLNMAQLPQRLEAKRETFNAARVKLDDAVKELETAVAGGDRRVITDKINTMHTQYLAVDEVFN